MNNNLLFIVVLFFFTTVSSQEIFKKIEVTNLQKNSSENPKKFEQFQLNTSLLLITLKNTSQRELKERSPIIISLPNGLGGFELFEIFESQILSIALSKKYPNIKSYTGKSLESASTVRFSYSPSQGFNAAISNNKNATILIKPSDLKNEKYRSYSRKDLNEESNFDCNTMEKMTKSAYNSSSSIRTISNDGFLRKYRLAVATTFEYSNYFLDGTEVDNNERKTKVLAAINVSLTRINGIFERDFGITMELVSNTDSVIFLNQSSDPFGGGFNEELQNTLDTTIGDSNYDVGHLFAYEDSIYGNAGCIACVCTTGAKGSGFTVHSDPSSDDFNLIASHEFGHQFGALHVQSSSNCRSAYGLQEVEPGSGSSIMSYAGICYPNVQNNSDDYFNYVDIRDVIQWTRNDSSCAELLSTGNTDPVVNAGNDYTIPKATPFFLEGAGSDQDINDVLSFCWEENDPEDPYSNDYPSPNQVYGPLFRSRLPITSPIRYMPQLSDIISGDLTPTWEVLPSVSRTMDFVLTVRDNAVLGPKTASDEMTVTVDASFGPFQVTSQNTTKSWIVGDVKIITWDVSNTNLAPINATNVDILLSIDGGYTYPYTIANNTPNDGSENINVPEIPFSTTEARFMIKASNNIFFSINAADIHIQNSEFVMRFEDNAQTVCKPNNAVYTFTYKTFLGFDETTTFSTKNLPSGLTATFNPVSASINDTTVELTIENTENIALQTHEFIVKGVADNVEKRNTISLSLFNATISEPILTYPSNAQSNVNPNDPLSWNEDINAGYYRIEIAKNILFTDLLEATNVEQTNYTSNSLEYNTTYYWRVKTVNICGESSFTDIFSFTTSCPDPSSISVSNTTANSTEIHWTENGNANSWEVEVVNSGTAPTGTGIITDTNSLTTSNLNSNTTYSVYIKSICGNSNSSNWVGPQSFTTLSDFCNGDHFYDSGGADNPYSNNENNITVISPNGADIVEVTFLSFNLEHSYDLLYVYNGSNIYGNLIGTYTGSNIPTTFRSNEGEALTFQFTSDSSSTSIGWEAEVSCITVSCHATTTLNSSNITDSSVDLNWTANGTESNWQIEYGTSGFIQGNGTLVNANANPFSLTGLNPSTNYDIYLKAVCGNNPNDDDSFWLGPIAIETSCGTFDAPYFYDVEQQNSGTVEDCWTSNPPTYSENYYWNTFYSNYYDSSTGPYKAKSGNLYFGSSPNYNSSVGDATELYSPYINIASLTNPILNFYSFMHGENVGSLHVDVLNNGVWTEDLLVITGEQQQNARDLWQEQSVDLSDFENNIQIRFRTIAAGNSNGEIDIDDISVMEMPSCPNPTNLSVSNITDSSVDLNWTANGTESNWQIEYGTSGFTQGNGTLVNANANPFTLSSLNPTTNYDIYLKAVCGKNPDEDDSYWLGPIAIKTTSNYCEGDHFYDSGGTDKNYQNSEYEITVISPFSGDYVTVEFLDFNLESCCDKLSVYDGPDVNAPFLGEFTGNSLPGTFISTHSTGSLTFHFTSDASITKLGWDAKVSCVSKSCPPPTNISVSDVDSDQVTINWNVGGTENEWLIKYGTTGFTQRDGTLVNVNSNPFILSDLNPATNYDIYLKAVCGDNPDEDDSDWLGPIAIETPCGTFTAPFYEDFASYTTPKCWSEYGSESWNFNTNAEYAASNAGDKTPGNNTNYAWIDGSLPNGGNQISNLKTPWIDISNLTTPLLEFYLFSVNENENHYNTIKAIVHDNTGASSELLVMQESTEGWKEYSFDLSNFLSLSNIIQIEFIIHENSIRSPDYNDILIDEIKIEEADVFSVETPNISDFKHFPNPVINTVSIQSVEPINLVQIYNVLGQEVYRHNVDSFSEFNVDVSTLSDGTYIVKAISDNKLYNFRIIKISE